jgi:hypothetical protein
VADLSTYRTECRRLLHDATGKFWSNSELNDYINDARARVASDTGCLRRLVTAYLSLGQETYPIGAVTGAIINDGGSGYVTPTVSFTGGGGTGAAATLTVTNGVITAITFTDYGSGYTSAPTAVIAPSSSAVESLTVDNIGYGYFTIPTLSFSGGGGSGAAGTVSMQLSPTLWGVTTPGSGYTALDILTVAGGTFTRPARFQVLLVGGGGDIATMTLIDGGDYTSLAPSPANLTGGTGVGATISPNGLWSLSQATLTATGSGYTSAPSVGLVGGFPVAGGSVSATLGSAGGASITVGIIPDDTLDILNITPIWGNQRIPMNYMPYTEFNAKMRTWMINPQQPRVWSRYGTSRGTAFVQPVPNQTYTTEFDTARLPTVLVDDATVDELSYPYTTPVAYYACWKAKVKQQAFAESQQFMDHYKSHIMMAQAAVQMRRIPNPYAGYTGG